MPKRIAITIAGAVSLGSYEAGVTYELLEALRIHNQSCDEANTPDRKIYVDVITGASAGGMTAAPAVDEDGLLRYRGRWVTLSPVERALAAALVDRFGAVVGRDTLVRRAWAGGNPTRNALDVHMLRLRRRIAELGLEVRTVRARGYVLQGADANGFG